MVEVSGSSTDYVFADGTRAWIEYVWNSYVPEDIEARLRRRSRTEDLPGSGYVEFEFIHFEVDSYGVISVFADPIDEKQPRPSQYLGGGDLDFDNDRNVPRKVSLQYHQWVKTVGRYSGKAHRWSDRDDLRKEA